MMAGRSNKRQAHDVGGVITINNNNDIENDNDDNDDDDDNEWLKLDLKDKSYEFWERRIHALLVLLVSKRYMTVDELRRGIEALPESIQNDWTYYEKWASSISSSLIERGLISSKEIDLRLGITRSTENENEKPKYEMGQRIIVKEEEGSNRFWRRPHLRVPGYIFGASGIIERYCGKFPDPELSAYRSVHRLEHLYRVRFQSNDLWKQYTTLGLDDFPGGGKDDDDTSITTVDVEIYESWLLPSDKISADSSEKVTESDINEQDKTLDFSITKKDQTTHHSHHHAHEHRQIVEQNAIDNETQDTIGKRLAESLVNLCIEKKIVTASQLTLAIEKVDSLGRNNNTGELLGPKIVARAWTDPSFRAKLLKDATLALADIGVEASNSTASTKLTAIENTSKVHNIIVCTLCSCYPLSILGLSPPWYKSRSYRARVVIEPRKVLREFGTILSKDQTIIRVHDSTADLRYIVIPQRPEGTDGWNEEQLQKLVTRDSMIGVREAISPFHLEHQ